MVKVPLAEIVRPLPAVKERLQAAHASQKPGRSAAGILRGGGRLRHGGDVVGRGVCADEDAARLAGDHTHILWAPSDRGIPRIGMERHLRSGHAHSVPPHPSRLSSDHRLGPVPPSTPSNLLPPVWERLEDDVPLDHDLNHPPPLCFGRASPVRNSTNWGSHYFSGHTRPIFSATILPFGGTNTSNVTVRWRPSGFFLAAQTELLCPLFFASSDVVINKYVCEGIQVITNLDDLVVAEFGLVENPAAFFGGASPREVIRLCMLQRASEGQNLVML